MAEVYLGLGTNLGDRRANLRAALERLGGLVRLDAVSGVYRSEPVGYREQPDFWNLVVRGSTKLAPDELLARVKDVERALGREPTFRNGPRLIDIDLLLYGSQRVRRPELQLPHPRMLERAFVLRPLLEVAPGLRHPGTGQELADHLAAGREWERTERLFDGARLLEEGGAEEE